MPHLRPVLHRALAAAVAPGGTLLLVSHSPPDPSDTQHPHPLPEMNPTAQEVLGDLDESGWEVQTAEQRPRATVDREGRPVDRPDEVVRVRLTS